MRRVIASKVPAPPSPRQASPMTRTCARSLARVLGRHRYRATYYGRGRDPESRAGLSGYEQYTRDTSNADVVAYLLWRFFPPGRVLDAGCAQGFVVEALRELDIDAEGIDTSRWAIAHAARSVAPFVRRARPREAAPVPERLVRRRHGARDTRTRAAAPRAACARRASPCVPRVGGRDHSVVRPESRRPARLARGQGPRRATRRPLRARQRLRRTRRGSRSRARREGKLARGARHHRVVPVVDESVRSCGVRAVSRDRAPSPSACRTRFGLTRAWCLYVMRTPATSIAPIDIRDPESYLAA